MIKKTEACGSRLESQHAEEPVLQNGDITELFYFNNFK